MEKKIALFSLFRYPVPADYEAWLERRAQEGWSPDQISQLSALWLVLRKGKPVRCRYVFDFCPEPEDDYEETYTRFGWTCLGSMGGCFVWRRKYRGERPESFSDRSLIRQRDKRMIRAFALCLALLVLGIAAEAVALAAVILIQNGWRIAEHGLQTAFLLACCVYCIHSMVKIKRDLT